MSTPAEQVTEILEDVNAPGQEQGADPAPAHEPDTTDIGIEDFDDEFREEFDLPEPKAEPEPTEPEIPAAAEEPPVPAVEVKLEATEVVPLEEPAEPAAQPSLQQVPPPVSAEVTIESLQAELEKTRQEQLQLQQQYIQQMQAAQQAAQPDAQQTQQDLYAQRAQLKQQAAQQIFESGRYKLNEDEANGVLEDLPTTLPRLAANLHVNVLESALEALQMQMPQMLQGMVQQMTAQSTFVQAFYNTWPQLKGHEDVVNQISTIYRQLNPNSEQDKYIQDVGLQSMMHLQIPPNEGQVGVVSPATPAATPAIVPPAVPHVPLTRPAGGAPPPAAPAENIWSEMAIEDETDD